MLNKELTQFAEHNKSDNQISEYIYNTFIDKKDDVELDSLKSKENNDDAASMSDNDTNNDELNESQKLPFTKTDTLDEIEENTDLVDGDERDKNEQVVQAINTNTNTIGDVNIKYVDADEKDGGGIVNENIESLNNNITQTPRIDLVVDTTICDKIHDNKSLSTRKISLTISQTSAQSISSNDNTNNLNQQKLGNLMSNIIAFNPSTTTTADNNLAVLVPSTNQTHHNEQQINTYGVETTNLAQLDAIMQNVNSWGIDVFLIDQLTLHHPLTAIAYTIFQVNIFFFQKVNEY